MEKVRTLTLLASLIVVLFLSGCKSSVTSEAEDKEKLHQMRTSILQLIGEPTCTSVGQCRYIPFGSKPCGGPWEYLIYSIAHTDPVLLATRVTEYNRFEDYMNQKYGYFSDCYVPPPPILGCLDGKCINLRGIEGNR
jgi:uncharacterized protein YceK